ncbi:ankyrin-1-like [Coccinella septempunctata]|uniref:ankyrin-1-like n=1 Tax=Coccinella septempunctata TaxID=41139 RepID=UPI001D090A9D|nr:ankyrin-1-like [Coccinella septempunctata]
MERRCLYKPLKESIIYDIVHVWSVQKVADFLRNHAAEWDFQADTMNSRRRTALDILVAKIRSERDNEVIRLLLEFGANPLWRDSEGKTTLSRIMRHTNDTELIITFLEKVEDINVTLDAMGANPLYIAVDKEKVEVLQYIMSRNPLLNITIHRGVSPLHDAVLARNPNISRILLENGADVNIQDDDGETPIFTALNGNDSIEQINILLQYGADLKAQDNMGRTPLHMLCASEVGIRLDILKLLLESGADPRATDAVGRTPLESYTRNDITYRDVKHSVVVTDMLMDYGAQLNVRNVHDQTLLHVAAMSCPCTFIRYIIHKGADTNALNGQGVTFLEHLKLRGACWRKVLQMLLLKEFLGKFNFGENLQHTIQTHDQFSIYVDGARRELALLSDPHRDSDCPSRFDLLISREKRAVRLCENPGLRLAMSGMDVDQFPIFGERLKTQYDDACRRASGEAAAEEFFFEISNGRLDRYASWHIIKFLPNDSLWNVQKCYQDMMRDRMCTV